MASKKFSLDSYGAFLFAHEKKLVLVVAILTGLSLYSISHMVVDPSLEAMIPEEDPSWLEFERFKDKFGSDEVILVTLSAEDIYRPRVLTLLKEMTDQLRALPHIIEATSLANVQVSRTQGGLFDFVPLASNPEDLSPEGITRIQQEARDRSYINDLLVSSDGRTAVIALKIGKLEKEDRHHLVVAVEDLLEKKRTEEIAIRCTGIPVIKDYLVRVTYQDVTSFLPIALILDSLILFLIFRSLVLVLIGLSVVSVNLLWTLAIMALSGHVMDPVGTVLPPVLIVLGISYMIYLFHCIKTGLTENQGGEAAILFSLRRSGPPFLLCTVTTSLGFASLTQSEIFPIQKFGMFTACGILLNFVLVISFCPALLHLAQGRWAVLRGPARNHPPFAVRVWNLATRRKGFAVSFFVVTIALGAAGISRLTIDTNFVNYFKPSSEVYRSVQHVNRNLSGLLSIEIMVEGTADEKAVKRNVLEKVEELETFLRGQPEINKVISLVDLIKELNRSLHENRDAFYRIPDTDEAISQLLLLESLADTETPFSDFVAYDYSAVRLSARLPNLSTGEIVRLVERVRGFTNDGFSSGLTLSTTGTVAVFSRVADILVRGQIKGFSFLFLVVLLSFVLLCRSLKIGLLCIAPNLYPIIIAFGTMGWLGIPLNTATAMVAGISLGIVVDDTFHFIMTLRKELSTSNSSSAAIQKTIEHIGPPISYTTVVLSAGFWILCISNNVPTIQFGLLSGITISLAFLADIVLLPGLLTFAKPHKLGFS